MDTNHRGYDPGYFAQLFAIEDRHFWFRARNRVIAELVKHVTASFTPGYHVLEVGCGTGNVLRTLQQTCSEGIVIGTDLYSEGLQYARKRTSCALVQADMHTLPFRKQFNVIGLFDVLEHLSDDLQVLTDLHSLLLPDGVLVLTVPAHPSLWSYFDEVSHHCRRYTPDELKQKLLDTGYQLRYLTQYFGSIFPLVWIQRRVVSLYSRIRSQKAKLPTQSLKEELRIIPLVNTVLTFLLTQEVRFITRRYTLPIGTSLLTIACKDSEITC